jgi:hypothetical protein
LRARSCAFVVLMFELPRLRAGRLVLQERRDVLVVLILRRAERLERPDLVRAGSADEPEPSFAEPPSDETMRATASRIEPTPAFEMSLSRLAAVFCAPEHLAVPVLDVVHVLRRLSRLPCDRRLKRP